jgi:hypothetical protein
MTNNLLMRAEWLHYDLGSTSNALDTATHSGNLGRAATGKIGTLSSLLRCIRYRF